MILGVWTVLTGRVHKRINQIEINKVDVTAFNEHKDAEAARYKDLRSDIKKVEYKIDELLRRD